MEIVRSRGSYSSCSPGARKDGTFRPKDSSGYMNLAIDLSWGDSPWSTRALRSYSSLYCSVKAFLPLLGSCAVVRPPAMMQRKTVKQMGIRDLRCFSQRGSVVQACVVERRMSNMSRHQLGQCSAHGPALNTGMPSTIDLNFEVRHA